MISSYLCLLAGTSPRTRGKPMKIQVVSSQRRNIPAHAGKTFGRKQLKKNTPEHPRACGENLRDAGIPGAGIGTSPRTRGKRTSAASAADAMRNIPAHAGKTATLKEHTALPEEHPRARGENCQNGSAQQRHSGTSPRTRGKLTPTRGTHHNNRNIPAHAGKTENR